MCQDVGEYFNCKGHTKEEKNMIGYYVIQHSVEPIRS